jgi:outer membrane lipoprotein SlyB
MISAFGVEHSPISKIEPITAAAAYAYRKQKKQQKQITALQGQVQAMQPQQPVSKDDIQSSAARKPSAGRVATTYFFPGFHAAVAGRKGQKWRSAGSELGHTAGGSLVGRELGAVPGLLARNTRAAKAGSNIGAVAGQAGGAYRSAQVGTRRGRYMEKETPAVAKSAFGVEHAPLRKDDISDQAKAALVSGMRNQGMAFTGKPARKQFRQDTRMAARTLRSGPYSGENRKRLGGGTGAGAVLGAGLGAGIGAIEGGGRGAKLGAAIGSAAGGLSGADVASQVNWQRASMRGLDRSIARGGVQTGVPKKDITVWTNTRKPQRDDSP